jgi:hypothetical protein
MNPLWFLRMSRWVRRPPSQRRLLLVAVVIALVVAIWALERWGLWPDWATTQRLRLRPPLVK